MEDQENKQRLLLAGAMCLLVWSVWDMMGKPSEAPPPETPVATATAAAKPARLAAAPVGSSTLAVAGQAAHVTPQTFGFKGNVRHDGLEVPYEITLSNIGGGIQAYTLPGYKERDQDNQATDNPIALANPMPDDLHDVDAAFGQMAGIGFSEGTSFTVPARIPFEVVTKTQTSLHLRYRSPEGVVIEREYEINPDSSNVEMAVTVRNESKLNQQHQLQMHSALKVTEAMTRGGGFFSNFIPPPDHLQALCYADGEVEREDYAGLAEEDVTFKEGVSWVAMDRQYFLSAIISRDGTEPECKLSAKEDVAQAALVMPNSVLKPNEEKRYKFTAYLGVKKQSMLTLVDEKLVGAVDFKIMGLNLAVLCTGLLWVLGKIFGLTGSWGLSILGLTVLVKLILFPLNQRSGKSMRAMAALKPQMEEIKQKYPDDRQRQSEETMKLYKDHNVSLGGGCLPIVIQMPIWFALYRSLWVSVDLYQESFLWIGDLTTRDPYWILPVVLVVVMFLQQKMTPSTMDPAQQKMMQYTMPLVFGTMMATLPAGLCFYILVNTLLTIVQQHFINKSIGPIGGPTTAQEAKA